MPLVKYLTKRQKKRKIRRLGQATGTDANFPIKAYKKNGGKARIDPNITANRVCLNSSAVIEQSAIRSHIPSSDHRGTTWDLPFYKNQSNSFAVEKRSSTHFEIQEEELKQLYYYCRRQENLSIGHLVDPRFSQNCEQLKAKKQNHPLTVTVAAAAFDVPQMSSQSAQPSSGEGAASVGPPTTAVPVHPILIVDPGPLTGEWHYNGDLYWVNALDMQNGTRIRHGNDIPDPSSSNGAKLKPIGYEMLLAKRQRREEEAKQDAAHKEAVHQLAIKLGKLCLSSVTKDNDELAAISSGIDIGECDYPTVASPESLVKSILKIVEREANETESCWGQNNIQSGDNYLAMVPEVAYPPMMGNVSDFQYPSQEPTYQTDTYPKPEQGRSQEQSHIQSVLPLPTNGYPLTGNRRRGPNNILDCSFARFGKGRGGGQNQRYPNWRRDRHYENNFNQNFNLNFNQNGDQNANQNFNQYFIQNGKQNFNQYNLQQYHIPQYNPNIPPLVNGIGVISGEQFHSGMMRMETPLQPTVNYVQNLNISMPQKPIPNLGPHFANEPINPTNNFVPQHPMATNGYFGVNDQQQQQQLLQNQQQGLEQPAVRRPTQGVTELWEEGQGYQGGSVSYATCVRIQPTEPGISVVKDNNFKLSEANFPPLPAPFKTRKTNIVTP